MHNVARAKQKPERVGKPEAWPTANGRSEAEPPFGGGFCFSAEWLGLVRLAVQCMRNNATPNCRIAVSVEAIFVAHSSC